MGSAILEFMSDNGYVPQVDRIGIADTFIEHGSINELYKICGMDVDGILKVINKQK